MTSTVIRCDEVGLRHYEVVSPEMLSGYTGYEPQEPYRCWGIYLAKNAREARVAAVKSTEFAEWVKEARGAQMPPFSGLVAIRALCEHGSCYACWDDDMDPDCPECAAQVRADEAAFDLVVGQ
jgi:hypothetical protein